MQFTDGIRLVLIGIGDVEEALKQLAEKTGVSGRVTFTGRIAPDLLPAYTSQADLGISLEEDLGLNYRYALPNKVFDYIRSGVPVLVSDLPMMRELVETYGIGSIAPSGDPESLARVFSERVKGNFKAKLAPQLHAAAAELNWEREEPRLLELIGRALGNQPS
jgi:glycosyltransferase involved in cell wall biosynthesis